LLLAAILTSAPVYAQDSVKIGFIDTFNGVFADAGKQLENGARTYIKEHGDIVAGKKIEVIGRDVGGINPDVAKRLAQELVTRDNVDLLAGFLLTPNTLAAADVSAQSHKFMVVMNAGTSIITTKSPYIVRTSVTTPQATEPFAAWAFKHGIKTAFTMVPDYAPGHDSETSFVQPFEAAGGKILGSVRYPVTTIDFSTYVKRAKDSNAEAIFYFVPGGAQPAALAKTFAEQGIDPHKTKLLGSGEATSEAALKGIGEAGVGIITAWNYDYNQEGALNRKFVKLYNEMHHRNPDTFSIGGYYGMHVIYETLKKTNGNTDGNALIEAAKGMKWESPRGPMSIDPRTRDVVQTIYIREVKMVDGKAVNVTIDKIEHVKDPIKERLKQ
jgi:branched-chain amino acid transport system substrate-binding protein